MEILFFYFISNIKIKKRKYWTNYGYITKKINEAQNEIINFFYERINLIKFNILKKLGNCLDTIPRHPSTSVSQDIFDERKFFIGVNKLDTVCES